MFRSPRLLFPLRPTTSVFFQQFRGVHGIELKRGMVMDRNGRPLTVLQTQHVKTGGRGASYVQVECKDLETGKRFTERVRSQEEIKLFEIEKKYAQLGSYNITPGKGGKPIGTVTFELVDEEEDEMTIDAQKLEWPAAYYYGDIPEDLDIRLYFYGDNKFFRAEMPEKVEVKVASIITGNPTEAVLENGRKIKTPDHIKAGETITIKPDTEEYLHKGPVV